jgi:hypothetical protein
MRPLVLPALLVAACGGSPSSSGSPDAPGPIDAPRPVDAGPDAPPPTVRFAVLGDTGEGNTAQYDVGRAIKTICDRAGGCDFALLLGDNIYDDGVTSTTDSQWQTKFEITRRSTPRAGDERTSQAEARRRRSTSTAEAEAAQSSFGLCLGAQRGRRTKKKTNTFGMNQ